MLRARFAALLSLIALLLAAVMQGRGYVRCAMDGSLHLVACCQVAPWLDGQAFDDPACCEQLTNPSLAPAGPRVSPLLDLAALPPALPLPGVRAPLPDRVVFPPPVAPPPPARAGPPPPPIARRLAALSRLLS